MGRRPVVRGPFLETIYVWKKHGKPTGGKRTSSGFTNLVIRRRLFAAGSGAASLEIAVLGFANPLRIRKCRPYEGNPTRCRPFPESACSIE